MKILLGILVSIVTTFIWMLYMCLYEFSSNWALTIVLCISIIGYIGSFAIIDSSVSKHCQQAYMDGYTDGQRINNLP